ncbi:MAG: phospholipase [Terriglobia bacterium]|nr:MAG: phospholipase [Terriglobia bacterium]
MRRRTFLKAAGAAATAPWIAKKAFAGGSPVQHLVLVMMENRSFDHFLGWFPNADGKQAGLMYPDLNNQLHATFPLAPDYTGCAYPDPDHSYDGARTEYDSGNMDGFLKIQAGSLFPIGYYTESDIPFLAALARNYTTCDRYFPAFLGPTFPNRIFQHAGQTDRLGDEVFISTLPTIWDHLAAQGITGKYYYGNIPFLALWGKKYADISRPYSEFLSDCAAGTLPAVSFVDPTFTTVGNVTDDDDHPHSDIRNGDAFLSKVFNAVTHSPSWPGTVLIINFDEWGGFFDHVPPPRAVAPNNVDPDVVDGKAMLGIRVPCVIASPWTRGNPANPTVNHTVFDHTSVLKLIESVWSVPPLAARETSNDVGNLLNVLNFSNPQPAIPDLPKSQFVLPSSFCS